MARPWPQSCRGHRSQRGVTNTSAGRFHLLPVPMSSVTSQDGIRVGAQKQNTPVYAGGRGDSLPNKGPGGDEVL